MAMGGRWRVPIGCGLAVLALVAIVVVAVGTLTWNSIRNAERVSETTEPLTVTPDANPPKTSEADPLKVLLEVDSAELFVEPAAPGEPLTVEAHYDRRDFRMEERSDDGYHLRFLVESNRLITTIKQGLHGGQPQLRIRLPVDTPIDLTLVQRNGGSVVDLSGLQLVRAEFDIAGALSKIDADRPLVGDLESLTVVGRQGGVFLESVDLMAPRRLDVDFRLGQASIDLRGEWRRDLDASIEMDLLDSVLRLPRDVRVEGLDVGPRDPGTTELPRPTLRFHVEKGRRATMRVFD